MAKLKHVILAHALAAQYNTVRHGTEAYLHIHTLVVQLESMERMLRHTLWIVSAGLHSSYKIDKQMCPFV